MRLNLPICLLLLISCAPSPICGQRYKFQEFRQESGLGNLATTALLQDRDHYLWVGTQNGLFRYDGAQFKRYGTGEGLPGSYVIGMVQAPDGTIWVNTHLGIARFHKGRFVAEHTYANAADASGMGMAVNANGDIFVSSPSGIVIGRKTGREFTYLFRLVFLDPVFRAKTILQLSIDDRQRAWFGCGKGLCVLSPEGLMEFHQEDWHIPKESWDGILRDDSGTVWLRSNNSLLRMTKGSKYFEPASKTPLAFDLSLLFLGPKGKIYLPSRDGLWIHDPKLQSWRHIGTANGLAAEPITAILGDHEDNLWIGFFGLGVMRWLGYEEWEGWTQQEGLNSNTVWTLMRDSRHTLWAGTDNGINYFDEVSQRWRSLGGEAGKSIGRIMSFTADGPNVFWASSQTRGLVRIDAASKAYVVLGFPKLPGVHQLFNVFLDRDSRLWLGTNQGLYQARTAKPLDWAAAEVNRSEEVETIYTVTQDSRGRVWAAGNAGLLVLDRASWRRMDTKSGLLSNSTWFARETRKDVIAVGYLESVGGSRILWGDGSPVFSGHMNQDGANGFMSYFQGVDKSGLQWTGTDRGVFVANGNQVHQITDQDGLIWNDCNSNAFFADEDGSVWIGTTRGLAHARLQRQFRELIPALKVASLKVNDELVELDGQIRIPSLPNSVELLVSPLNFHYGNRIQYQFRLGRPEDPWETRSTGVVNFSGISGGAARLQARVKLGPQAWSETLIDLPVEVAVPFWQSWMGRSILGLALALGVALLWRYRNKKLIEERTRLASAVTSRTSEIQRLLQEAREANRLKTEFLANMSHEIRTPMNGVLGMLQLTAGTELNPEQRNFVDLAKRSAESLLSLLNEILDLSKVESGFLELDEQPFVLRDCINQICSLLEPNARGKGIQFEGLVDASVPVRILGDRNRLQQVLLNLVGNAIKFTDSGFVKLKVHTSEAKELNFMVEDSGIGIPPEKQAFIFDAFRQADGSTTRRFGGTGLGLAISQKLVVLMGGTIKVESEAGLGSRFWFSIPIKTPVESEASLEPAASVEAKSLQRLQILLAEDNRVNQVVVTKLLERQGHTVILAEDGALAVEAMLRQSFDLILMDIHMPVLDGIRATEKIREIEIESGKRIPIVALSAGVLAEERKRCFEAGMNAFLGKPVRETELREMLARFTPQ